MSCCVGGEKNPRPLWSWLKRPESGTRGVQVGGRHVDGVVDGEEESY